MRARTLAAIAGSLALFGLAPHAHAAMAVLHYDGTPSGDFRTAPYTESGITTTVDRGHYEFYANATGTGDGDRAFNLDEQQHGLAKVTITAASASAFDVVSLDVVNPADTVGEYTITAIGGTGGSIPVPTVAGPIDFTQFAPAFHNVTALVVTQNAPGSFTFDNLKVNVLPEPARGASLLAAALLLFALRRRAR
jgi:hypothetical protein